MTYQGKDGEFFEHRSLAFEDRHFLKYSEKGELSILWFKDAHSKLRIDGIEQSFDSQEIISLTAFNQLEVIHLGKVEMIRWNPAFYCVLIHDSEVSCKGILFYGASRVPSLRLNEADQLKFQAVWDVMKHELGARDKFQQEMLQMLLKRILILCTRWLKEQEELPSATEETNLLREFNYLVEQHFRTHHAVRDYADLLHKSPKTLANYFKKIGAKSPLQYIHDRRMIESRRLLHFTDKPVYEIADDLGFGDVQSFSRFFKKQEGLSPVLFKENGLKGKIAK